MIKKLISFLVVTSTVLGCFTPVFSQDEAVAAPEKDFQIYVETDERQTYEGFGWSAVGNLDDLSDRDRETAYKLIFDFPAEGVLSNLSKKTFFSKLK